MPSVMWKTWTVSTGRYQFDIHPTGIGLKLTLSTYDWDVFYHESSNIIVIPLYIFPKIKIPKPPISISRSNISRIFIHPSHFKKLRIYFELLKSYKISLRKPLSSALDSLKNYLPKSWMYNGNKSFYGYGHGRPNWSI